MTDEEFGNLKPGDIIKYANMDVYFVVIHDPAFNDLGGLRKRLGLLIYFDAKHSYAAQHTNYAWWPGDWTLVYEVPIDQTRI